MVFLDTEKSSHRGEDTKPMEGPFERNQTSPLAWHGHRSGASRTHVALLVLCLAVAACGSGILIYVGSQSAKAGPHSHAFTTPGGRSGCPPSPLKNGNYYIKNRYSNDVMEVPGFEYDWGFVLDQWPQNNGANQQWQVHSMGCGTYRIASVFDQQVVSIFESSKSPGAYVDQWPYWAGPNQIFRIRPTSGGNYTITNVNSNDVVEVPDHSVTRETPIDQNTPDGRFNQQWSFSPVS